MRERRTTVPGLEESQTHEARKRLEDHSPTRVSRRQTHPMRLLIVSPDVMTGEFLTNTLTGANGPIRTKVLIDDSKEVVDHIGAFKPHVAIISEDLQDGPRSGFKVLEKLHLFHRETSAIMLLKNSNPESVIEAFRAGARGILYRTNSLKALRKCVRVVHRGEIWVGNADLEHIVRCLCQAKPLQFTGADGSQLLTRREDDIVRLVVDGMKNSDVARALRITEHSVRNYLYRIFDKLGVSNRVELTLYAFGQRDREPSGAAQDWCSDGHPHGPTSA